MLSHGINILEQPTSILAPVYSDSAVQVVVGTAPVNLLANPQSAVNTPIQCNSFDDCENLVGFSYTFSKFTCCESMDFCFNVLQVYPVIFINVLDPSNAAHITAVTATTYSITSGQIVIPDEGIMQDSHFVVKKADGTTTYVLGTDYSLSFNSSGYTVVTIISTGAIGSASSVQIAFNMLNPAAVTTTDIIGGIDGTTGKATGLQAIKYILTMYDEVPGLILAPGWSQNPTVKAAMTAQGMGINGIFKAETVCDIDSTSEGVTSYTGAITWKTNNSYNNTRDIVCWPMVQVGSKLYHMSAAIGALIAYTDGQNGNVPFVSPSNQPLPITGACLANGTEVYLDIMDANTLNGGGIVTALNMNGWRAWGNYTGCYPGDTDPKDFWIPGRRMFDWEGNSFILTYFQKVDSPMNIRAIETIVDTENIKLNGLCAKYQLAGGKIVFNIAENPTTSLISGTITFHEYFTFYPPMQQIDCILEFDPTALSAALGGGS